MHRLLKRQLKRVFGDTMPDHPAFEGFVELVDQAYQDFGEELDILGRSIDVSSEELNMINANLNGLLNAMPDTYLWLDCKDTVRDIRSQSGLESLLFDAGKGQPLDKVLNPQIKVALTQHIDGVRQGIKPDSFEFELTVGAESLFIEARFALLAKRQVLVIFRDVTVRKLVENLRNQALEESRLRQQQLQDLINSAPIGIVITTMDNEILMLNQYALNKLNVSTDGVTGSNFSEIIPSDKQDKYHDFLGRCQSREQMASPDSRIDIVMTPDNADHFVAELRLSTLNLEGETIITQTFLDISERKEFERKLKHLAQTDPLTGSHNRRYFQEHAEQELILCRKQQRPFSLMLMDLDKFKSINDTFGHAAGDEVLKVFSKMTQGLIRDGDIFGRFGGEEFVLALPGTDGDIARQVAERICQQLAATDIHHGDDIINVTVSIGLISKELSDSPLEAMIKQADELLYHAKEQGRNRVISLQDLDSLSFEI